MAIVVAVSVAAAVVAKPKPAEARCWGCYTYRPYYGYSAYPGYFGAYARRAYLGYYYSSYGYGRGYDAPRWTSRPTMAWDRYGLRWDGGK